MIRNLFENTAEIDEQATAQWYAQAEEWGCTCGHCRNFLAIARRRELPLPVMALLDELAIPPEKSTYTSLLDHDGGKCLYHITYRTAGRILDGTLSDGISEPWGSGFCEYEFNPYGAPNFPEPHFDIAFVLSLPWVLDDSIDA